VLQNQWTSVGEQYSDNDEYDYLWKFFENIPDRNILNQVSRTR
jgi:hypothetical protein